MNREEKYGRALMDVYGGKIVDRWSKKDKDMHGYRFRVKFDVRFLSNGMFLSFRNWHEFLFGSKQAFHNEEYESANFYLKKYADGFNIIEYSSLDELDIQLTLMGRNPFMISV